MGVASEIIRRHNFITNFLIFWHGFDCEPHSAKQQEIPLYLCGESYFIMEVSSLGISYNIHCNTELESKASEKNWVAYWIISSHAV